MNSLGLFSYYNYSITSFRIQRKLRFSHPIEDRPQAANDRSERGHWEADTVAGKTGSSCLITLACSKSRLLLSLKIPKKTSAHVRDGMIQLLSALPPELVRSVTPDRDMEFAKHAEISTALNDVPFFFPPPHSPRMRGTNENTNGLIREYCTLSILLSSPPLPTRSVFVPANVSAGDHL